MRDIYSDHNETFKSLKKLATNAKFRRRTGQTLVEGVHLCESYLNQGGQPLLCVYTEVALSNPEVSKLINNHTEALSERVLLSEGKFKAISSVENGIGLMFVVNMPNPAAPEVLKSSALLLDDIQDPGNLGTMLRTAAAAGVDQVYCSRASASAWSPKALRAGMGAQFVLDIYENCDLEKIIQNSEVQVLATSLKAQRSIYQMDLSGPTAWLFGNEGSGVSDELLSLDVMQVIIPQNENVESLNVAASAAVCMFEQARQSRQAK